MILSEPLRKRPGWQSDPLLGEGPQAGHARFFPHPLAESPARPFQPAPAPPNMASATVGATHVDLDQPADSAAPERLARELAQLPAGPEHTALAADSATAAAAEALQAARAAGYAEGHAAGLAEGRASGLREGEGSGFAAGRAAALDEAHAAAAAQIEAERSGLRALAAAIGAAAAAPRAYVRPLEKLALHLALQLVRAELTLSGAAIRKLVERCGEELEGHPQGVTARLHPDDAHLLLQACGGEPAGLELLHDAALARGSVVLEAAGAVVEDLIETRLESLCAGLLDDPAAVGLPAAFRETAGTAAERAAGAAAAAASPRAAGADAPSLPAGGAADAPQRGGDASDG